MLSRRVRTCVVRQRRISKGIIEQLRPGDLAAVVRTRHTGTQNFTADRARLLGTLPERRKLLFYVGGAGLGPLPGAVTRSKTFPSPQPQNRRPISPARRENTQMRTAPSGRHLAPPNVMRVATLALVSILVATVPVRSQQPAAPVMDRDTLIAALERLMTTGEPRHLDHDDGELLQAAVDEAMRRGDEEIERLARRAAVPLLARVTAPVSTVDELPSLSIEMPPVLKPTKVGAQTADIFASLDGGDLVPVGRFTGSQSSTINKVLPEAAHRGLHHLRLRAHITYAGSPDLAPEVRDLPEIVFAIYDPADPARTGPRLFVENAIYGSADRLDPALPRVPFGAWLHDALTRAAGGRPPEIAWRTQHCDERDSEPGLLPRTRQICAVALFPDPGRSSLVEIWIRTGRIELDDTEVRWLAEAPTLEALRLESGSLHALAAFPDLFLQPRDNWPTGDIAVAPEDVTLRRRPNAVDVTVTIRNFGGADVHNAFVMIIAATGSGPTQTPTGRRSFVVNVPAGESAEVAVSLPMPAGYGTVLLLAQQISNHAPFGMWAPDPTPDDNVAFRIVNPRAAPRGYADLLRAQCGSVCRGF